MAKYRIDEKTIWEDTGKLTVHNYPPSSRSTMSYITRTYREFKKDQFGWKEVDGPPIYFHDMKTEHLVLAQIISQATSALNYGLPIQKELANNKINENENEEY